jgi:LmbE family N-acetylglucosaminyl deacetylase
MRAPVLVFSPHLDDGVFACGQVLAAHPGAVVATVFAGGPADRQILRPWDRDAGFAPGDDVVAARRVEDRAALAALNATPHWLDFPDQQYVGPGGRQDRAAVEAAVEQLLHQHQPALALLPLGLFHSDHVLASDAVLAVAAGLPGVRWAAYEDALYRRIPGLVQDRLVALRLAGWRATPVDLPSAGLERKRPAVACYASQLRALATLQRPGHADAFAPERFWSIERAPDAAA